MKYDVGGIYKEKVKSLKGFNEKTKEPILKDDIVEWEIIQVYPCGNIMCRNNKDELRIFLIQ